MRTRRPLDAGLTLIELIVFIVVVSVGLVGVLSVFNLTVRNSADPMLQKQMLAIAEAMMEEVLLKDYQNDPANPDNTSATLGCTLKTVSPSCRPNNVVDRPNYNDIDDYDTYTQSASNAIDGSTVTALAGYTVKVAIDKTVAVTNVPVGQAAHITVTVTLSGSPAVTLDGYRTNYGG
jgi:MSHA pilin protein MshD